MNPENLQGHQFTSGPFASTNIHNGGTIFGVIYEQILAFDSSYKATLGNRIILGRASDPEWKLSIENEKWEGKYSIDSDNKHVKCDLVNLLTTETKKIYADFISTNVLIAEVYDNDDGFGKGQVFTIKNAYT